MAPATVIVWNADQKIEEVWRPLLADGDPKLGLSRRNYGRWSMSTLKGGLDSTKDY